MKKRKLREWEIPMNFSQKEKKEFNITTEDQISWYAKKTIKNKSINGEE